MLLQGGIFMFHACNGWFLSVAGQMADFPFRSCRQPAQQVVDRQLVAGRRRRAGGRTRACAPPDASASAYRVVDSVAGRPDRQPERRRRVAPQRRGRPHALRRTLQVLRRVQRQQCGAQRQGGVDVGAPPALAWDRVGRPRLASRCHARTACQGPAIENSSVETRCFSHSGRNSTNLRMERETAFQPWNIEFHRAPKKIKN